MMIPLAIRLPLLGLLFCVFATVAAESPQAQEEAAPKNANAAETGGNGKLAVAVDGVEGPLRDNVLANLELNRFAGQAAPEESRMRWLHTHAESQIREALQPFGYYESVVAATLNRTPDGWEARYSVQPGRALHIVTLDVQIFG